MKIKRNIYIIVISIVLYFISSYCYENLILKNDYKYIFLLNKNVSRGDLVLESDFVKVKVSGLNSDNYLSEYTNKKHYKDDYSEGYIVLNEMIISNDEYINIELNKELVSIKLDFAEDAGSYQIEKGSIVNVFYSAKLSDISEIMNNINKESIISNKLDNGYVTIRLLDNIRIKNCYDKFGKVATNSNVIQTILVETSKEDSMKINNLKNYGKFSVSIIK
jgi:hypothetical protein